MSGLKSLVDIKENPKHILLFQKILNGFNCVFDKIDVFLSKNNYDIFFRIKTPNVFIKCI